MDFSDDFAGDGPLEAPYETTGTGTWNQEGGQLVHTSGAGLDAAVVDVEEGDVNVITPLFGAQTGQFLRYIDLDNTLMVVAGTGPVSDGLWKIVEGAAERVMATDAILGNANLESLCVGDTIRVTSNDVIFGEYELTGPEAALFGTTAPGGPPTKFGIRAFGDFDQAHESLTISRYIGNVETYPADVDIDVAVNGFGINLASKAFDRQAYETAKRYGAEWIRWPFGWEFAEDIDNPGFYPGTQLPIVADALGWCAELGLKPMLIAQYGPPRSVVATVHVDGSHPIGSTSLTVVEDVSEVDFEFGCHFIGAPGMGLGKAAYYGGIVADIPSTHVVELGAATTGVIAAGTELTINRLLYSAIATDSGTDPSAVAFANYSHALALAIAEHCPAGGAVELYNEPPWHNDYFDQLSQFFDNPAAWGVAEWDQPLSPIIKAVAGMDWPANVVVLSSGTNKSGQGASALNVASKEALAPIVGDSMHPYNVWPPVQWWGQGPTCVGTNWGTGHRNLLGTSSFAAAALQGDAVGFERWITECGYGGEPPTEAWVDGILAYSIQMIAGSLAMGYKAVIFYSLADAPYAMADPVTLAPHPSLVRIGQFMRYLRTVAADVGDYTLPTIRFYEGTLPLFRVNIGPVLVCWQRAPSGEAPNYDPEFPTVESVRIADVPGAELRVLNSVHRAHESVNVGPDDEHTLYFGAEPLVVTWRAVG